MPRAWRVANAPRFLLAALAATTFAGCATLQQIAALRRVEFDLDRVSGVRVAGVLLDGRDGWSDLRASEVASIAAAVANRQVPLELVAHVRADNPADNPTARLVDMDWTFFIEDRKTVSGRLDAAHVLPAGRLTDVPLDVSLDLADFFSGGARDLFELAMAIRGQGTKEVRLEAVPTIETSLGPIRYPAPVVIRRQVGAEP